MDAESKSAIKLLEAIAANSAQFAMLARYLRDRPSVIRVIEGLECRRLETGTFLAEYVDVELQNGKAVAWWLEVSWNEAQWAIESRITVNDAQGQDVIREFEKRTAETLDECINQLLKATSDLVSDAGLVETVAE
jgi:hypothetical protein